MALIALKRPLIPARDPRDAVIVETNLWKVFTNNEDYPKPWTKNYALCKHCMVGVQYETKSELVIAHLRGCEPFKEYCVNCCRKDPNFIGSTLYWSTHFDCGPPKPKAHREELLMLGE